MTAFNITSTHFDNLTVACDELMKLQGVTGIVNIKSDSSNATRFTILCQMANGKLVYHDVECFGEGYFGVIKTH